MRIKLLVGFANPDHPKNAGDVIECDDAEAIRHIAAGHAVPHAERVVEQPEKAKAAVEKRTKKRGGVIAAIRDALS